MTVASSKLDWTLPVAYRRESSDSECMQMAERYLGPASEALAMALLTLGAEAQSRADKLRQAEQARTFLVEAVTALSRARIYLPGVHTHTVPFVLACESAEDAELVRLHQLATRLSWKNHVYLPARGQSNPLAPEEEAQLAKLLQALARSAQAPRTWLLGCLVASVLGPIVGIPTLGLWILALLTLLGAAALGRRLGTPALPPAER